MAGEDYGSFLGDTSPPNITKPGRKNMNGVQKAPTDIIKKTISYVAFGDAATLGAIGSQKVLDLATSGGTYGGNIAPEFVRIINEGKTSIVTMFVYKEYTTESGASADHSSALQCLLKPGDSFEPPIQAIINQVGDGDTQFSNGEALSNVAPTAAQHLANGAIVDDVTEDAMTDDVASVVLYLHWTSALNNESNLFRVGDLLRIDNEIMEVTDIGTAEDLPNTKMTVKRGMYGSAIVVHAADAAVSFPFFNAYHDYDKYTVPQTDANGKFKAHNFFGYGRNETGNCGITPSSVCLKFYGNGYQEFGLSGISASTESGLTAGRLYGFDITVDGTGGIKTDLSFTLGTSTLFGGTNGVIRKIQDALDVQFYTTGSPLFEKKVIVGIYDGDIRLTSSSRLSTSAILLANATGAGSVYNLFSAGRIPAIGNIMTPMPAILPEDVIYDKITNATSPNDGVLAYDNGKGMLGGGSINSGTINYETGAIDFRGPANAEFVVTALYNSPFSGRIRTQESTILEQINSLISVHANNTSQKHNGQLRIELY